jgi:Fic family protein
MDPARFTASSPGHLVPTFGGVLAFVPAPLPRTLDLDLATVRLLSTAERRLGALGGATGRLLNPWLLAAPFLRQEAILSSRIEGTITTPEQLALLEVVGATSGEAAPEADTQEVANFVRATEHALRELDRLPVSVRLLRDTHRILMTGVRGNRERPGELRDAQNFIGAESDIRRARFVPPPHTELPALLDDFERYANDPDPELPLLVRVALLHYQFETIHPFRDGNGRIGRLLVLLLLLRDGALPAPLLPVSTYLERHRERYMDLLLAVSVDGAWLPWVRFFLEAIAESATHASAQVGGLLALRDLWHARLHAMRSSALLLKLVDALFQAPALSIGQAAVVMDVTHAAASANVQKLVEAGILTEVTGRRRGRVFLAPEILRYVRGEVPSASPPTPAADA